MSRSMSDAINLHLSARQCSMFSRAVLFASRTSGSGSIGGSSSSSGSGSELILALHQSSGLRLHGVNRSKTSCIDINFKPSFFEVYAMGKRRIGTGCVHFGVYAKVCLCFYSLF